MLTICPRCKAILECDEATRGQLADCPWCSEGFTILRHTDAETTLMILHPSLFCFMSKIVVGCLLLFFLPVGIIYLVWVLLTKFTTTYTITSRRVIVSTGVLSRKTIEIRLRDVREVQLFQPAFRILRDTGDIGLSTASGNVIESRLRGIRHCVSVKRQIDLLIDGQP